MSNDADYLRLAVLAAIIEQHGPLPCLHIRRLLTLSGRIADLHFYLPSDRFVVEAAELCTRDDGAVMLSECGMSAPHWQSSMPMTFAEAVDKRDSLQERFTHLLWNHTTYGDPLVPAHAMRALRRIRASAKGVQILPCTNMKKLPDYFVGGPQENTPTGPM